MEKHVNCFSYLDITQYTNITINYGYGLVPGQETQNLSICIFKTNFIESNHKNNFLTRFY
jgi:hypothetical protein